MHAFSFTVNATLPLVAISLNLAMAAYAIRDLYRPERRVQGGDKTIWLFIILFGGAIGCLAYLLLGRRD